MAKIYGVEFRTKRCEYFKSDVEIDVGSYVVVNLDGGLRLGKVAKTIEKEDIEGLNSIVRVATDEDYEQYMTNLKDADKAFKQSLKIVKDLGLEMNIINASFTLDRSQLLFNFTASSRVDFRDLAKKLASIYHTRIELRQIGARDKAREVSGVGICGGELCCVRFLKTINNISMNMAKDQNLALNPSKINGSCGRLLCCLQYEDETYLECLKGMPSMGDVIKTPAGEGPVVGIDILNRKVKVLIDGDKIDYEIPESSKK